MTKIDKRGGLGLLAVVAFAFSSALGAACGGLERVNPADASVPDGAPPVDASVPDSAMCVYGTFAAKDDFGTGIASRGVAVSDFNGDTKLDLVVTSNATNTVSILLGVGNGAFGAKVDYAAGATLYYVAVGDFNGDQKPDLAVTNSAAATVSVLLNQCK
jgi:hypothetical protein